MNNQSDSRSNPSGQQDVKPESEMSDAEKNEIDQSAYVYKFPVWDLMPPASFVIRRVHRL